jgi:hypothetical protein
MQFPIFYVTKTMKKLSYIWVVTGCFNFAHCFFFKDSANIPQLFVAVCQYEVDLNIYMLFWHEPRVAGASRTVEAIARDGQVDQTNCVQH